jgi:hypothetical protein
MRFGTPALKDVLRLGDFNKRYVADFFSNGVRMAKDVPITMPRFDDSASSLVQGTGSFRVIYQDDFAREVSPSQIGDLFSPFGTQVAISVIITVGAGFTERVPLGLYLVSETPSIITTRYLFNGALVTKGDQIDISIKDLFYGVQRDRFQVPGSPPDLSSVWAEVQRLTGLTVTKTITDGVITAAVAYQEDKLQAVYDLATVLDATACMLSDGTVSMRPNVWPAAVDALSWGDAGTLVSAGRGMANDLVYNQVVVRSYDSGTGAAVLAMAELTTGPLRTRNADGSLSPYRRVPYFYSSQFITTAAQAQAYADLTLPRVSKLRSVSVKLTEIFNPLRDIGDVITVNRLGETFLGRVTDISRTDQATQETTVAVGQ